jgi:hypothetical protein
MTMFRVVSRIVAEAPGGHRMEIPYKYGPLKSEKKPVENLVKLLEETEPQHEHIVQEINYENS